MLYGEHLCADEVAVQCACGISATVEVFDRFEQSCGWFCRSCSHRKRAALSQQEKIAKAIVRGRR